MDRDARRVSELLGGEIYGSVDLVIGAQAVEEHCVEGAAGCGRHGGGPVWTNFGSVGHEFVHAFTGVAGRNSFIEEGLAEALGGGVLNIHWLEVNPDEIGPLAEIVVEFDDSYEIAGHFVVWLIDGWGLDRFLAFRSAVVEGATFSDISMIFEAVYGMSFEMAEAAWRDAAPSRYKVGEGDCEGPSDDWVDEQRWSRRLVADCSQPHTFGPLGDSSYVEAGMRRTFLVDVTKAGHYEISVDADREGVLEIESYRCGCWGGIEGREYHDVGQGLAEFGADLWPCRYRVSFVVKGVERAVADVEFEYVEGMP